MSTAVTIAPNKSVAVGHGDFSREQVELLKDTICKGATDQELALFLEVCKAKRLDPFAKQIHPVKRWDNKLQREVMTFQTGIDGFRLIAERTGCYQGQDDPLWCGEDGVWKDVWLAETPPMAAKVGVYKSGFIKPITRVALFREYVQTTKDGKPNSMWAKMGSNQLAKCAEALSLRAAFPEELGNLYTPDEMGQSSNGQQPATGEKPLKGERYNAAQKAELERKLADARSGAVPVVEVLPAEEKHDKPWHTKREMLEVFHAMAAECLDAGFPAIYNETLTDFEVIAPEEFTDGEQAFKCYMELFNRLDEAKAAKKASR